MTQNADSVPFQTPYRAIRLRWRRAVARPFHKAAHGLDGIGWWITEQPERKRKKAMLDAD
jgi:hypothetical protein